MITWEEFNEKCGQCKKCRLCEKRTNVVIGKGSKTAEIMFIGEGPGEQEDMTGVPFVGLAGQLLSKMLLAAGIDESHYYICNVVKCRPPKNRVPLEDEVANCMNYLRYQFLLVRPKIIVCLGSTAAKAVIDRDFKITQQRGVWSEKKGISILATYHPAALLRDESKKKPAWEDMKSIRKKLDEITNAS